MENLKRWILNAHKNKSRPQYPEGVVVLVYTYEIPLKYDLDKILRKTLKPYYPIIKLPKSIRYDTESVNIDN